MEEPPRPSASPIAILYGIWIRRRIKPVWIPYRRDERCCSRRGSPSTRIRAGCGSAATRHLPLRAFLLCSSSSVPFPSVHRVRYCLASRRSDTFPLRHIVGQVRFFPAIRLFASCEDPSPQSSVPILVAFPHFLSPFPLFSPLRPQNPSLTRGGPRGGGATPLPTPPFARPSFSLSVSKGHLSTHGPIKLPVFPPSFSPDGRGVHVHLVEGHPRPNPSPQPPCPSASIRRTASD